jgi:zinc/manganese transport system substrate-binding protein
VVLRIVLDRRLAIAGMLLLSACGGTSSVSAAPHNGPLRVVAAENFWGSIAAQLGGDRVEVTSVIANPATDPHDYEPSALDARALAGAQLAIVNGVGYDPWAAKLLDANPVRGRDVVTVGDIVHVAAGANPHRWYAPADVRRVIAAISRAYAQLDPHDAAYFAARNVHFEQAELARYDRILGTIRTRYRGVRIGASESIVAPLASALGLRLETPPRFLKAVSEGADPTAADRRTIDRQIAHHEIVVWVVNGQNATPDVARLTMAARNAGIPVVTLTETLSPASARFQDWQAGQLERLAAALHRATGR